MPPAIARLVGIPVDPPSIAAPAGAPAVTATLVRLLSGEPAWVDDDLRHTCESLPDLRLSDALAFHGVVPGEVQVFGPESGPPIHLRCGDHVPSALSADR